VEGKKLQKIGGKDRGGNKNVPKSVGKLSIKRRDAREI
jgi:hypothetical protein